MNSYHECDASEAEKECVSPQVAIANQMRHFLCMYGSSVLYPPYFSVEMIIPAHYFLCIIIGRVEIKERGYNTST